MKSECVKTEEYFEEKEAETKIENMKGKDHADFKKENMNEVEKVKDEKKSLKNEVARLTLRLKDCKCGIKIKLEGAKESSEGLPEGGREDEEVGGGDLKRRVGERKTNVVAKPVKRKLSRKKTKVYYNEDPSDEEIDDPDIAADNEPNHSDRAAK